MWEKLRQQLLDKKELYLRVKVSPRAPQTVLRQVLDDGTLKIALAAPAQKGKANQELIRFLAEELDSEPAQIKILVGAGEAFKIVKIIS